MVGPIHMESFETITKNFKTHALSLEKDRAMATVNIMYSLRYVFKYASGQMDRHTDKLIANTSYP